ncbi:DHA2 family efflux MFS transporter permease subunit [Micromonospora sp. PLK6-60]|uniref:DHA2 family efflux MFS transporter permease subunit n=1 Tax=Micromonospora sp. PLK6-60 TaxID=2873383 RepID=UPI001CA6E334|nr:DHA2 family efflux MFS transporter permease subunit [Micromonospora sp. PLK6-60]MBY8874493.1 DHA2 family efflux MFS transporter permease subunit [Micromonospora sp. PLK6-60]
MGSAVTASEAESGLTFSSASGRWTVAAMVLGSAMASIDATVVGIALPAIGREFNAGLAALQWVVIGYTLTLAGLLLVAGALGDRYGRRRVFVAGVVWFAVASLLCAVAPTAGMLVAMRALQGVGAALLTPGSLAILQAAFAPADRSRAIGAWSGLGGVATAIGPFVGGWLVAAGSWRLIFLINLPLAALVVAMALRHVPESRDRNAAPRIDITGGTLVTLGLVGLTYGLIQGPGTGWTHPAVLTSVVGGTAALAGFLAWEHRAATPMLPLRLFRSVQFSATNAITFIVYGALGGALFLLPIQLQQVSGYTPLQSGIALLPVTIIMLLLSAHSGALAARIGPRVQMSVGPVLVGAGLALLVRVGPDGTYATQVLPAVIVFGLGLATTVAPLTSAALNAAPAHQAGIASAVNNDVARAAALIAVAVLPAAAGITGGDWQQPARFSTGFHTAVLICAALCLAGGLLAALTIRRLPGTVAATPTRHLVHCALDTPPAAPVSPPSTTGRGPGSLRR